MKKIVVLNGKGGVGKSNITRHLAVAAELEKPGSSVLCDTDPQSSLAEWWNSRASDTPPLAAIGISEFASKEPVLASRFDFIFFDTAAASADKYAPILQSADLIVVPVLASPDELRSLNRMTLPVVRDSKKPFFFVFSKVRSGTRILLSTMAALSQHGPVSPVIIEERTAYAESGLAGLTVLETEPKSIGATEIRKLWEDVKSRIDESTNSSKNEKELLHV